MRGEGKSGDGRSGESLREGSGTKAQYCRAPSTLFAPCATAHLGAKGQAIPFLL